MSEEKSEEGETVCLNDGLCGCRRCIRERDERTAWGLPLESARMILCPTCGNKRCPHATDHRLACTGSNESGQHGSYYT